MAVTQWEVVNPGVVIGAPRPMPGVVVNGGSGSLSSVRSTGRLYPFGPVVSTVIWEQHGTSVPAGAQVGSYIYDLDTGILWRVT